jgi:hypothetical protein
MHAALVLFLMLALCLVLSDRTAAQDPMPQVSLVPEGPLGTLELASLTVDTQVQCDETGCQFLVEEEYRISNSSRTEAATATLRLEPEGTDIVPQVQLDPGVAVGSDRWTVDLPANSSAIALLRYTWTSNATNLLHYQWDPGPALAWRIPGSVRLTLVLPDDVSDDIFLTREPEGFTFDGRTLEWSYEGQLPVHPHGTWMLSPAAWAQLTTLEQAADIPTQVALLRSLREEAKAQQAPYPDPWSRILGLLLQAIERSPSPESYLALADQYQQRFTETEDNNYRLLAIETLEQAIETGHSDDAVRTGLAAMYTDMAAWAAQSGDASRALAYLTAANRASPETAPVDSELRDVLILTQAVDLAARGKVADSLLQLGDQLAPAVQDALYRYAPPVRAARTDINRDETSRGATYTLLLYPPVAGSVGQHLNELAARIDALEGIEATLLPAGDDPYEAVLHVVSTFADPMGERMQREALYASLEGDPSFVAALIAAPWKPGEVLLSVERSLLFDTYRYREQPTLLDPITVRDEQLEYTRWRLAEITGVDAGTEKARLEQQLVALALRQERQIWESLSASTYWSYSVTFAEPSALAPQTWLLGWGQERPLEVLYRAVHWGPVGKLLLVIAGGVALLSIAGRAFNRSSRRQRA